MVYLYTLPMAQLQLGLMDNINVKRALPIAFV